MEVDGGAYCAGDSDQMMGLVQDPATTPPSDELASSSDAFLPFWTVPNSSSSCHAATDTMPDVEDHGVSARPPSAKTTAAPTAGGGELATEDDPERSYRQVQPEKKRRLSEEQVRRLEKNFELENKLEPERKSQLAKEIGLEPRQVAIWFQNRRARYKTKQLERDYGSLKASYDRLMADYDLLKKEKEKLDSQVIQLTNQLKLTRQETVRAKSEPTTPIDCANTSVDAQEPTAGGAAESTWEDASKAIAIASCKQEDASSARSVVFDPDSPPHCADYHGGHNHSGRCFSNLLEESANSSSLVAEPERGLSGFLQDEDQDRLCKDLSLPPLPSSCDFSPKIEDGCYEYDLPSVSNYSCNFAILNSVDDQHSFWSWMH